MSLCLFNLYAEYIMRNAGLEEAQAGLKIARRNINNLRYADDTTLMVERSVSKLWELMMDTEARCAAVHGVTKSRTRPSNWTELS